MATYSVNERTSKTQRKVVVNLILNNPSSTEITVNVQSTDVTATGMSTAYYMCNVQLIHRRRC